MGGSGGGQGSGKVEYAAYLETAHTLFIGTSTPTTNMVTAMNTATASAPYSTANAYDPSADLAHMAASVVTFNTAVDQLLNTADITADADAFAAILDDQIATVVVPRYNAHLRDICAVQSSAFAIGLAEIYKGRDRDVAKYTSEIKLSRKGQYIQGKRDVAHYTIETDRMKIASKHDEEQRNTELDALDAGWKMDVLMKGGQLLGALGGGTHVPDKASKAQSAVAGALAGAAAGAYVGSVVPGVGTAAGAVAGGIIGAGATFL